MISRANHALLSGDVVVGVSRTDLTDVFCGVPDQRGDTHQTLIQSGVVVVALSTDTLEILVVIDEALAASLAFLLFFVPVSGPLAVHT